MYVHPDRHRQRSHSFTDSVLKVSPHFFFQFYVLLAEPRLWSQAMGVVLAFQGHDEF